MRSLLDAIALLSDKVGVRNDGVDTRKPSFAVTRPGEPARIGFAGLPMGHEFTSVSYTHLDVYKRQDLPIARCCGQRRRFDDGLLWADAT